MRRFLTRIAQQQIFSTGSFRSRSASTSSEAPTAEHDEGGASASHSTGLGSKDTKQVPDASSASTLYSPEMESNPELKEKVVQYLLSRDKELFNLKRQHELALLRIEQGQERILKQEQSLDMYREHGTNCNTFEEVSLSHYHRRGSFYMIMNHAEMRVFKAFLWAFFTVILWVFLYYKYIVNPEKEYIAKSTSLYGSNYQSIKRMREDKELEAQIRRV
jgi:hypothetical protein